VELYSDSEIYCPDQAKRLVLDEHRDNQSSETDRSPSELQEIAEKLAILAKEIKVIAATPLCFGAVGEAFEGPANSTKRPDNAARTGALPQS